VGLLRAAAHGIDLAVTPAFTLPTALPARGAWLGEGTPTFVPELAVSRDLGALRVATNVAYRARADERAVPNLTIGPEVVYRAGVGVRRHELVAPPFTVDASLAGATRAAAPFVSGAGDNPLEALLSLRHDLLHVPRARRRASSAAPPPPTSVSSPACACSPPHDDLDDDGVVNASDACADKAEDEDDHADGDGCPDLDNDADGVAAAADRCPNEPEDRDGHADDDGCPDADNEGDGVEDAADRCPDVAGPVEAQGYEAA